MELDEHDQLENHIPLLQDGISPQEHELRLSTLSSMSMVMVRVMLLRAIRLIMLIMYHLLEDLAEQEEPENDV
jgi:hypothetical protein